MSTSRREFIQNGLTFVSLGMTIPAALARASAEVYPGGASSSSATGNILVVLQMFGGNDGLNTVIPYTDPLYYQNRPTIGIAKSDVLQISDKVGFHPAMTGMKSLYEKGHLAVVQGVGYPNPNLSHFRSTEIWETADSVSEIVGEGWLGRYFDDDGHLRENPLVGINFGAKVPHTLYTDYGSVVSMENPTAYQMQAINPQQRTPELDAFTALYSQGTLANDYSDLVRKIGSDAYTTSNRIQAALKNEIQNQSARKMGNGNAKLSQLTQNLKYVAELISADLGTKVFYISTGGFDTHAGQPPTQARLLADLSESLEQFYSELERRGLQNKVTLVTFSEFGRRVQENASSGTDHGTASSLFVMGGAVKGGLYGQYPSLEDLDMGNLKFNTDFRDVYSTLLEKWLGVPSQKILEGTFSPLPLLS